MTVSDDPTPDVIEDDEPGTEDFDAFWSARTRKRKATTIMGERVELPASLPLQFEMEARRLQRSKNEKDIRKLLSILFGDDVMNRWAEKGMDLEQLMVLLAWAPQVIVGKDVTLAQVADELAAQQAKAGGQDPT